MQEKKRYCNATLMGLETLNLAVTFKMQMFSENIFFNSTFKRMKREKNVLNAIFMELLKIKI